MPVEGSVTGLNKGGLEIDLGGIRGFCPTSQIDVRFVEDPSKFVGQTLQFRVTEVKGTDVVLSRRALLDAERQVAAQKKSGLSWWWVRGSRARSQESATRGLRGPRWNRRADPRLRAEPQPRRPPSRHLEGRPGGRGRGDRHRPAEPDSPRHRAARRHGSAVGHGGEPGYLESLKTYEEFAANDSLFQKAIDQFQLRAALGARPIESLKKRVLQVALVRNTRILEIAATLPDASPRAAGGQVPGGIHGGT